MSRSRAVTSPPKVTTSSSFNPDSRPADLEAQLPATSAPATPDPDHNARSPNKESLEVVNRRLKRSQTSRSYRPKLVGRQWKPGEEPGIDPNKPHPGTAPVSLRSECQITVVDYSQNDIEVRELTNEQLREFLEEGRDEGLTCRWINVNRLSWDVISLLGREKKFHRLAIEDMLNRRNRTKADWYSDHTYIVLPLQKLVHVHDGETEDVVDSDSSLLDPAMTKDSASINEKVKERKKSWTQKVSSSFSSTFKDPYAPPEDVDPTFHKRGHRHANRDVEASRGSSEDNNVFGSGPLFTMPNGPGLTKLRTLQRYQGGHNLERIDYMEANSALRSKDLAVTVEQVSIFLTADNTVVSFFEASADDIEAPIINRLSSRETILRRSTDASMLVQAILDAIIDLAIPVTAAYKDAVDELELNVLTDPAIEHTRSLYILISEITSFRSNISPVGNLVNALRDHKSSVSAPMPPARQHSMFNISSSSDSTVVINPTTYTYLGDVEDHILLITDGLDQMRRASDNMIDLIFNTISAYQNEAMRQLTTVTIVFLPLTFITGYFGMNFKGSWDALENGDYYFWEIAMPVSFIVTIWLLRGSIQRWFARIRQRRRVKSARKRRGNDGVDSDKQKTG